MADNRLGNNATQQKLLGNRARQSGAGKYSKSEESFFAGNANERRYLWTARAFAVFTAISVCCNIVLAIAIGQVMPLFRIEPFLLTFQNKQEQIVNIVPIKNDMNAEKGITETFVRQYILLRSSFSRDIPEMESRWQPGGLIQEMSSRPVYEEFQKKTAEVALQYIREKQLTREVKILSVVEPAHGLWQVEYETRDMYPDSKTPDVNYWTASLQVGYRYKTVKYGERLKNPVGFTVVRYSLAHNNVNTTK